MTFKILFLVVLLCASVVEARASTRTYLQKGKSVDLDDRAERENKKGRLVRARLFKDGKLEKDEEYFADGSKKTKEN